MNYNGEKSVEDNVALINESNSSVSTELPTSPPSLANVIEEAIYTKAIFPVCLFGIGGNVINLIVLSQRSLVCTMKRMERSAHYGLIALAVSDLLVCLTAMSSVFITDGGFAHASFDFRLVHKLYSDGVINTFILLSTWLTATMAVSRYIAICHPLQAREIIGKRFTVTSLVVVILGSVLFNVPRFLRKEPLSVVNGGQRMYFEYPGLLQRYGGERAYLWTYFALGIVIPLCILVFSNAKLVMALRSSKKLRAQTSIHHQSTSSRASTDGEQTGDHSANRITLTLIVIIVFFILLFVPAEMLNFFMDLAISDAYHTDIFNIAQAIGNLLQTVNFAFNFVMYCVVNKYFRQTMYRLVRCLCCRAQSQKDKRAIGRRSVRQNMIGAEDENESPCTRYAMVELSTNRMSFKTATSTTVTTHTS